MKIKFYTPLGIDGSGDLCSNEGGGYLTMFNGVEGSPPLMPIVPPTPPAPPGDIRAISPMDGGGAFHCGRWTNSQQAPPMFESTVSKVTVIFHSGTNARNYEGFHLKWVKTGPSCGDEIYMSDDDPQGVIQTENYPEALPGDVGCVWTIFAPVGKSIQLDFNHIVLGDSKRFCDKNFIKIFDQSAIGGYENPVATICPGDTEQSSVKTVGNVLVVEFQSVDAGSRFQAVYDYANCGGVQAGTSGLVQSEGERMKYVAQDCETLVKGPSHSNLNFTFGDEFNVNCRKQGGEYQSGDYVELIDFSKEGF